MSDEELNLAEIKAINAARTPGEWVASRFFWNVINSANVIIANIVGTREADREADQLFIARASTAIPALIKEVERLNLRNKRLAYVADEYCFRFSCAVNALQVYKDEEMQQMSEKETEETSGGLVALGVTRENIFDMAYAISEVLETTRFNGIDFCLAKTRGGFFCGYLKLYDENKSQSGGIYSTAFDDQESVVEWLEAKKKLHSEGKL